MRAKKHIQRFDFLSWLTPSFYFLILLVVLRNGINYWGYDFYALSWSKVWPKPVSVFSVENFGNIAIAHFLHVDSRIGWLILHIVLTLIFFILLVIFVSHIGLDAKGKQSYFVVLLASPFSMMLMQEIGYFDVVTITGALILANCNSLTFQLVGAIIMASGNSPQALISTLIFCFANSMLSNSGTVNRIRNFLPFFTVTFIWLLERIWLDGVGRTEEFGPGMWTYSIKGFLIASPLYFYSILGPIVLLIPKICTRMSKSINSKEICAVFSIVFIPMLFGIVTTESTRDALCIMAPGLIWFLKREISQFGLRLSNWEILGCCALPCFLIWREGSLVEPWSILHRLFF